jgi:hypothetical protein
VVCNPFPKTRTFISSGFLTFTPNNKVTIIHSCKQYLSSTNCMPGLVCTKTRYNVCPLRPQTQSYGNDFHPDLLSTYCIQDGVSSTLPILILHNPSSTNKEIKTWIGLLIVNVMTQIYWLLTMYGTLC